MARTRSRSTSTMLNPGAVLSNKISSGAATMARPRSPCRNRFCVVTTTARFSMARAQIKVRQVAHSRRLSVPAGMKISSAPRQRAGDFRHVDLAAHGEADLAVRSVEHRKVVGGDVLEFPVLAAGID